MVNEDIKVLVVDDEEPNLDIIAHSLKKENYTVECVNNGDKALLSLNTNPDEYHLILLDRMMPGIDGMEVLRIIQKDPKLNHIPVIMQTAAVAPNQVEEGIKAGAYYYLTKPFSKEELLKVVKNAANDILLTRKEKEKHKSAGGEEYLDERHFEIRTLDEAKYTALYLANLFADPSELLFGFEALISNAVLHGNLALGPQTKGMLERHGVINKEVDHRLKLPENKDKSVHISLRETEDFYEVVIEDQGEGFAWEKYMADDQKISSIKRIRCFDSLEYVGEGNKVKCKISIKNNRLAQAG